MKLVNNVEWDWSAQCPECATTYSEFDERVDTDGTHPVVTCDNEDSEGGCGCVFEVACIEC